MAGVLFIISEGAKMMRKFLTLVLLACFLITTGCGAIIAGAAAGLGVYSYYKGELKRSYPESYPKTVEICLEVLQELKISVEGKESDGIKTTITAVQTDGTPLTLIVDNIAPRITEVSARSGLIGVWDKKVSELIHATIAQKIQ